MDTTARPLRADAERRRQAIICAAGSVFAEEGTAVTLEHIAEKAGVGVGTIYRRFPSIEALVGVVFEEKMRRFADEAVAAAERARTEPWDAFADYVMFVMRHQAEDLAFSDVILSPGLGSKLFRAETRRALAATQLLVERAQAAGAIRADFDESDLFMLQHANAGLIRRTQRSAPTAWKRFAEYMLQAFRVDGGHLEPPSATWLRAGSRAARDS
ncbi:TetR/AcrR family transcriptional regulator [Curtobacterium sp. NPDC089689]|uniref:TetR/AcrR family transcriptional regulator n=1 Tax=Curtobacterium sp. NPDC089689 TaxID=3363968 RepID=UPI00382B06D6